MTQPPAPAPVNRVSGGAGALFIVLIAFIALKLAGAVSWSWWWVTAPAWIPGCTALLIGIAGLLQLAATRARRRR